jgi:hypothetical protein
VRQELPRHSVSHQAGTSQLTFGALEFQNTNTTKSLSLPPFVFMPPLRQQGGCVRNFHAIPHRAGLAPPNSRCGLLNCRIRTQQNHYPKYHLSSRAPCVSRGVRQALPRHSASRRVGTPQLTLGALEDKRANLFQQKRRGPKPAPKWFNRCKSASCQAGDNFDAGKVDTRWCRT